MSERNWFIFRQDHHLGPFSLDEILDKVKLSDVGPQELVWREGDNGWRALKEQEVIIEALEDERQEMLNRQKATEKLENLKERQKLEESFEAQRQEQLRREKQREGEPQLNEEDFFKTWLGVDEKEGDSTASTSEPEENLETSKEDTQEELDEDIEDDVEEVLQVNLQARQPVYDELPSIPDIPDVPDVPDIPDIPDEEVHLETEDDFDSANDESEVADNEQALLGDSNFKNEDDNDPIVLNVETKSGDYEPAHLSRFYIAVASVVCVVITILVISYNLYNPKRKLFGLTTGHQDALENVMERDYHSRLSYRLRPTTKLSTLWFAANYPGEASLFLELRSIEGRLLGKGPIRIQTQSKYYGKAAHFNEFEFIEGSQLVAGEYHYRIKAIRSGFKGNFINQFSEFLPESIVEGQSEFLVTGTILLSTSSLAKFESQLTHRYEILEKTVLSPLRDQKERYKTYMGLLEQVENIYHNTLERIKRGRSISLFEKSYNENVGPFLRDLILDNNRTHLSLTNIEPQKSQEYERLMEYGKEVGLIAADMATKTAKYSRLGSKSKNQLKTFFGKKILRLKRTGLARINEIDSTLISYGAGLDAPNSKIQSK